jgi:ABC-type phosphate/phosphonate transport system permease subunit
MDTLLRIFHLIALFFPPYWSLHYFNALLVPIGQTIEMAAGGIFIALIVGMLTGIWVGAGLPGGRWIYRALSAFRSIPDRCGGYRTSRRHAGAGHLLQRGDR